MVSGTAATQTLLTLRMLALAAAVVLGLPAIRAYTGGPSIRLPALALTTWYAVAAVLWLTTDLVHRPGPTGSLPVYGPLAATVDLVPVVGRGRVRRAPWPAGPG